MPPKQKNAGRPPGKGRGKVAAKSAGTGRGRGRGRGNSNATPAAQAQAEENASYIPKKKITIILKNQPIEQPENEADEAETGRGRRAKNTHKYNEAINELGDDEEGSETESPPDAPTMRPSQGVDVEDEADGEYPGHFIDYLPEEIINMYHLVAGADGIQMELPDMMGANPIAELAQDDENDVKLPFKSHHLVYLYILAYTQDNYHICDLITDIWIRAFQRLDENPKTKMWKVNRSNYIKKEKAQAPRNDNGPVFLHSEVTSFNLPLLKELYEQTNKDCGARLLWADAMALCGNWLEKKTDAEGSGMAKWHPELMWDVLRTSLRLARVRVTLKIEEKNPTEWCSRYHEHVKHGAKCYREVKREEDAGVLEEQKIANGGVDNMEVDSVAGVGADGGHAILAD